MTPSQITRMVGVEYDLCVEHDRLKELSREIAASGVEGAHSASRGLRLAAVLVRRALKALDAPLTEAARMAESLASPPF